MSRRRKAPSHPISGPAAESRRHLAAAEAAKSESQLAPGLYVTATPIGNASDITLRALEVLAHCDAIVAEDTRVTARLLAIHKICRPLIAYNDHNAPRVRPGLIARLRAGARLALVSDAGTPLISDPGLRLVRAAIAAGVAVHPVPGASAALAALGVSGLPTDRFLFAGFLPAKQAERRKAISALRGIPATLVLFEAPGRLRQSLADLADVLGPRPATVAREMTKLHEEIRHGTLAELAAVFGGPAPKGEITLVIGPPAKAVSEHRSDEARIDQILAQALDFMPVSAAAALLADAFELPKRKLYARALALKNKAPGGANQP